VRVGLDAQLLVVERGTGEYRFRHALIGEVVHGDPLAPQRTRFHRRVAEALGGQPAEVLTRADRAGELAFHVDRAGDQAAAFLALLAAADAARQVAPGAALRHRQRALELWGHAAGASRADRRWQAAELASEVVGNERGVELAGSAFEVGQPPQGEPRVHERLDRYLWGAGQFIGVALCREAFSVAPTARAPMAFLVSPGFGRSQPPRPRRRRAMPLLQRDRSRRPARPAGPGAHHRRVPQRTTTSHRLPATL
jgi:hypothetical protein